MCLCNALPACEEQLKGVSRRRDWRLTERIEPVDRTCAPCARLVPGLARALRAYGARLGARLSFDTENPFRDRRLVRGLART